MKVYVIHYKPLAERIGSLMGRLFACDLVGDIEVITAEDSHLKFATVEDGCPGHDGFPGGGTTKLEQSVLHKHFRAFDKISCGHEPAIILEDDALFDPKKMDAFIKRCETKPDDLDWCFFGTGLNLKIPGEGFVKQTAKLKSKCADSMLVTAKAASIIHTDLASDRAFFAIDWELNHQFLKHKTNVYWYEPGFVTQGSENGTFKTCHER
jgi:hypothetical protein